MPEPQERDSHRYRTGVRSPPGLFKPDPYLSDAINRSLAESEVEGGVHLADLLPGAVVEVETQNHAYTLLNRGGASVLISGHPQFCPNPRPAKILGSSWGGTMLKEAYIGRGMHLQFRHAGCGPITTSRILEVRIKFP
jgi:hypothetical protein